MPCNIYSSPFGGLFTSPRLEFNCFESHAPTPRDYDPPYALGYYRHPEAVAPSKPPPPRKAIPAKPHSALASPTVPPVPHESTPAKALVNGEPVIHPPTLPVPSPEPVNPIATPKMISVLPETAVPSSGTLVPEVTSPIAKDNWLSNTPFEAIFIVAAACIGAALLIRACRQIGPIEVIALADLHIRRRYERILLGYRNGYQRLRHTYWSCHSDPQLQQVLKQINQSIEKTIDRATTLFDQADRFDALHWDALGKAIRHRAKHWTAFANSQQEHLESMTAYFEQIVKDRHDKQALVRISRAEKLCAIIGGIDDQKANAALAELYKLRSQVQWDKLVPPHLAGSTRSTVDKAYRQMAGTSSLSEARAAWAYINRTAGITP